MYAKREKKVSIKENYATAKCTFFYLRKRYYHEYIAQRWMNHSSSSSFILSSYLSFARETLGSKSVSFLYTESFKYYEKHEWYEKTFHKNCTTFNFPVISSEVEMKIFKWLSPSFIAYSCCRHSEALEIL